MLLVTLSKKIASTPLSSYPSIIDLEATSALQGAKMEIAYAARAQESIFLCCSSLHFLDKSAISINSLKVFSKKLFI